MPRELFSAERAIGFVANFPRTGQIEPGIYVSRFPTVNGEVVDLTATWEGAARLTGDSSDRFVSLGINPNLIKGGDVPVLKTEQGVVEPASARAQIIFNNIERLKEGV